MLRRLYDRTMALAETRHATSSLAVVSFVESSVFPIPPDVLMIPMIIAKPLNAWKIAAVATIASVLGALLGYWIGYGLFETVGRPVLEFYGKGVEFEAFAAQYNTWGAWAVLVAGITPFPFKVITIASGATALNLPIFLFACIVARGLRFFVVGGLLRIFGAPIRDFIERLSLIHI